MEILIPLHALPRDAEAQRSDDAIADGSTDGIRDDSMPDDGMDLIPDDRLLDDLSDDRLDDEGDVVAAGMIPDDLSLEDLIALIGVSLDANKAEDIIVIDLVGKSSFAEYMVVASGRSSRQVGAMAEHLVTKLKAHGIRTSVEGLREGDWVLLDAGDVVVHLFRPEVRSFYNLEKMWGGGRAVAGSGRPAADSSAEGAGLVA